MNLRIFYRRLNEYYDGMKTYRAEWFLKDSLVEAKRQKHEEAVLIILNELGGFYRAMGRYSEAAPLFVDAICTLRKLGLFHTENHATTLINQATNYAVWGRTIDALELFEAARLMFETLGITVDFRIASLHNNMSIAYQDMGEYDKAVDHLKDAIAILEQLEDTQIEIATTYTNIAQCKYHDKSFDDAMKDVNRSIELFEEAGAFKDPHYAVALETKGHVCDKLGLYEESLDFYTKACELVGELYGEDHRGYQSLLFNVGKAQRKLKEKGKK